MFRKEPGPVRTGIAALRNASAKAQRRAVSAAYVRNPVLPAEVGGALRAVKTTKRPPFDLEAIKNAYLMDGIVRDAQDKYAEVILKEGWYFDGAEEPVKYLLRRFDVMTLMTGTPWEMIFEQAVRSFVKYGNTFLAIQRTQSADPIPGMSLRSLQGKSPIGGYFNLPTHQMAPEVDEHGKISSWVQSASHNRSKSFASSSVLHFTYCREPGEIWGMPPILGVIEDVRALRQAEESVLKLIYKHINPLIHQEVPDITGTGEGRQEDVDMAAAAWQASAPDGLLITPPGHKLTVLGAESQAIRAEGYIDMFRRRVFTGMAVSPTIMGEEKPLGNSSADTIVAPMHTRAKIYQYLLAKYFTVFIINELLMEGGFDPWNRDEDKVFWTWNEIEVDKIIKEQTHALNLWTMNAIRLPELRMMLNLPDVEDLSEFYIEQVQIPQLQATAKLETTTTASGEGGGTTKTVVSDPDRDGDGKPDKAKSGAPAGKASSTTGGGAAQGGGKQTRNRVPTKSITRTGGAARTGIAPQNQHTKGGPSVKPGAPTAHKMSYELRLDAFDKLCEVLHAQHDSLGGPDEILCLLQDHLPEAPRERLYPMALCLSSDASDPNRDQAMVRIQARMNSQRLWLTAGNSR